MAFDLYFAGTQHSLLFDWIIQNCGCKLFSQVKERTDIKYWIENGGDAGKLFIDSKA